MADSVRILPPSGDYLLVMPRNARCVLPGHPYHVTQRGTDRQTVFRTAAHYKVYLALLGEQLRYVEVSVHAWCLMPNHVHLVVTPHEVEALAFLFRRVHGRYAQYFNAKHHRTGHLWQNRFYSCILAGSHVRKALRYVERNPVRAEIAERPADYRWSSAAAHLTGKDPFGVLDWSEWERLGKAEGWRGCWPRRKNGNRRDCCGDAPTPGGRLARRSSLPKWKSSLAGDGGAGGSRAKK